MNTAQNSPTPAYSALLFEASPTISVVFDDALQAVDANPAAVGYFGFASKEDLLPALLPLINNSIPAFQPDGSPTVPLAKRFGYVIEHGSMEFELEMLLSEQRVPMKFTLQKIPFGESFIIAGFLEDIQSIRQARQALMRQDSLMRQINRAAIRLMSAEPQQFESVVRQVLKNLAQSAHASRICIWENYTDNGAPACRELYGWESATAKPMQSRALPYASIPAWYEKLRTRKSVHLQVQDLPEAERAILQTASARVGLLLPVYLSEEFWGFISLDKSSDSQPFSSTEEKAIHSGGIITVAAIINNRINRSLIEAREAALASDKAKSEFLSRMSHEIRTPMNAIIGMTSIARKSEDVGRIHFSLDQIETASQQLLQIINDILDMSKIESGKLEISSQPFDLEKSLSAIFDVVKVRMDEKDQRFTPRFLQPFDRLVVCDELRLSQVVVNLLTNAAKFSPVGGHISLTVGTTQDEQGNPLLHIEVKDDGIGISAEQQRRLFRSFEQADGSITRRFGGTGLGLAICKSITNLMGGDIWVQSEEGAGATFVFEVAFQWGGPLAAQDVAQAAPAETYHWEDKQILVVEDVEINRVIIAGLLEETGVAIDTAENGRQAVDLFEKNPARYDLILMDVQMPELDGLAATGLIRDGGAPQGKTVPILAMTANAFTEDVQKCLAAGMSGHVAKPIDVEDLLHKMAAYLDGPAQAQKQ